MIHQISGRIHATELILISFRTFSRRYGFWKLISFCCILDVWPSNSKSRANLHDLSCLRLYSCYLGQEIKVYFRIIEVEYYNSIYAATLTVDLQNHGHLLCCPGNDAKLIRCVLGMTLNSSVVVQGMNRQGSSLYHVYNWKRRCHIKVRLTLIFIWTADWAGDSTQNSCPWTIFLSLSGIENGHWRPQRNSWIRHCKDNVINLSV